MKSSQTAKKPSAADESTEALEFNASGLRPVERALDLIGAKWTLIIIRHLLANPHGFQELRDSTGITPRLLSVRLTEMIEVGFVEKLPKGKRAHYTLTEFGRSLEPVVRELALWWLRHAMPRFGPHQGANPATVFEAVSYLLQRSQAADAGTRYDLRMTVGEDGGWAVEFTDGSRPENVASRELAHDVVAGVSSESEEPEDRTHAERLPDNRPGARRAATTAGGTGSVVWHPKPYRPDRR